MSKMELDAPNREQARGTGFFIYWKNLELAAPLTAKAEVVEPIGIEPMTSSLQS